MFSCTGDVPSAVLLFEGAVQQNPDSHEAWFLLGTSQVRGNIDTLPIFDIGLV